MSAAVTVAAATVRLGDYVALDAVSFEVAGGSTLAILGPNGAGKSTLIRAVLGLIPLAAGSISLYGKPVGQTPPEWIGYVPQLKTIDRRFPAVTCELVASGRRRGWPGRLSRVEHDAVEEALSVVGAGHLSHRPINWLSGGELQRVYLARALVRQPRLVLLDEPASGIDAVGEDDMHGYLEGYQRQHKATVLMITHDWLAARHHADNALLLNRRVVSWGPPAEALTDERIRHAFGHVGHTHGLGVSDA